MVTECRPANDSEIVAWFERFRNLENSPPPTVGAVVFDVGFVNSDIKRNPTPFESKVSTCFRILENGRGDVPPLLTRIGEDLPRADMNGDGFTTVPEIKNFLRRNPRPWDLKVYQAAAYTREEMAFFFSQKDMTSPKRDGDTDNDRSRLYALMGSYLDNDHGQLMSYWKAKGIPKEEWRLNGLSLSDWPDKEGDPPPSVISGKPDMDTIAHLAPLVDMASVIEGGKFKPKIHAPLDGEESQWFEEMIADSASGSFLDATMDDDVRLRLRQGMLTPSENAFFRPIIHDYATKKGYTCRGSLGCVGLAVRKGVEDLAVSIRDNPGDFLVMNGAFVLGGVGVSLLIDLALEAMLRKRCAGRTVNAGAIEGMKREIREKGRVRRFFRHAAHRLRRRLIPTLHLDPFRLYMERTAGPYQWLSRVGRRSAEIAFDTSLYVGLISVSPNLDSAALNFALDTVLGGGLFLAGTLADNLLWSRGILWQGALDRFTDIYCPPGNPPGGGEKPAQSSDSWPHAVEGAMAAGLGLLLARGIHGICQLSSRAVPGGALATAGAAALFFWLSPEEAKAMTLISPEEARLGRDFSVSLLPLGVSRQYRRGVTGFGLQSVLPKMQEGTWSK